MNALDILILAVVLVGFVKGLMCGFFSSGRLHCGVFSGAVGGLHALFRVGRLDSSLYRKRRIRRTGVGIYPFVDRCSGRAVAVGVYADKSRGNREIRRVEPFGGELCWAD